VNVLLLHNRYQQPGGEDAVFEDDDRLLSRHGITTHRFELSNNDGGSSSLSRLIEIGWNSSWSRRSYDKVLQICKKFRPDVAHVHNFWMQLTPAVHAACKAAGVPTVQTLHNFRLICANAAFLRDGQVCEDCLGKLPWRGVVRRCYRDSALASGAVAKMMIVNQLRQTWQRDVDAFIALCEHSRSKFVAAGLPGDRIFIKPNFAEEPEGDFSNSPDSERVVFVGRLSAEKGVGTLLAAWRLLGGSPPGRLCIVGDGPEREHLEKEARDLRHIEFVGSQSREDVRKVFLAAARVVVVPSVCFENFPRVIAEAFACGRPVVGSALGAVGEIVRDEHCGLTFEAGNAADLARALRRILTEPGLAEHLGRNARSEYLRKYTAERNYDMLLNIYESAMRPRAASRVSFSLKDYAGRL
jgi:glycosyltransferase involved in cell wall biosynthesis